MQYDLISRLRPLADEGYRAFHLGLVPELDAAHMLGVRMPALRAFGKELDAARKELEEAQRQLAESESGVDAARKNAAELTVSATFTGRMMPPEGGD